jgi:hypothetical protein
MPGSALLFAAVLRFSATIPWLDARLRIIIANTVHALGSLITAIRQTCLAAA